MRLTLNLRKAQNRAAMANEIADSPLRRIREKRKLTLEQVATAVGTDTGNLSRIERGVQTSVEIAELLVKFFGKGITELEILYPQRFQPPTAKRGASARRSAATG